MTIKVGERLPDGGFMVMTADGPAKKTTGDIFAEDPACAYVPPSARVAS